MKFELIRPKALKPHHFFHIVADNGEVLCHSEIYNSRQAALKAIKLIRDNAGNMPLVERGKP